MTTATTTSDFSVFDDEGKPKLPSGINVLTILTFIGSGLGLVFLLLTPVINKWLLGVMQKSQSSGAELSAKQYADIEKGKAVMELTQANMVPLMVIGIISIALCIAGALWMRKLKKDGFYIYAGGELLPIIGNFIVLGTAQYNGVFSIVMAVGLPLLFVILYFRQFKYLTN